MRFIAEKIIEARKLKGLTQEELAEQASINLRTVQRIEKSESEPRGATLDLICKALQIDLKRLMTEVNSQKSESVDVKVVNGLFLLVLNFILMGVIGFLTLDSNANVNSRFGAVLLSFFLPFFIATLTKGMKGMERMLKFGFGFIAYFVSVMISLGFPQGFVTGLFPCLFIGLSVLYFGGKLTKIMINYDTSVT